VKHNGDESRVPERTEAKPRPPEVVGPYRILRILGEGGMGVVYHAEHRETGEHVALKTVTVPKRLRMQGIRAEILALRRMDHPQIVRIRDHGVAPGGVPWYAMELLGGHTLDERLNKIWPERATVTTTAPSTFSQPHGGFNAGPSYAAAPHTMLPHALPARPPAAAGRLKEVLGWFRMLCEPLAYLHGRGVVHRDLKPSNVFVREDGRPVLMDFGLISRARGSVGRESLDVTGVLAGTVAYLSPEQVRRESLDARTDLYAYGCMLYEAITGVPPFRGNDTPTLLAQHLAQIPTRPSTLVTGVDPRLDQLILDLLAKERRNRIGHADEVARVLAELEGGAAGSIPEAPAFLYRPETVGRDEALREFDSLLQRLKSRRGAFVFLSGESGIGKTFLATEVARRAGIQGLRVVTAECAAPGVQAGSLGLAERRGLPLQALRPVLTAVADYCGEEGAARADRLFGPRAKLIASHVPTLASLPGFEHQPPAPDLPAEEAHRLLVESVLQILATYAAEGAPLLWLVDDLQWADELSLKILAAIDPAWLEEKGMMILCTYRSEEADKELRAMTQAAGARSIVIDRMGPAAVGRIAADMLAVPSVPDSIVRFLTAQTEGVPFFVAEYLRAALAEGLLLRKSGHWMFKEGGLSDADLAALPLPRSIEELMLRRLTRVDSGLRKIVDLAAVIGREVDIDLLARAADPTDSPGIWEQTLDQVRELVRLQILDSQDDGRYRFVHDKLRETAYQALSTDTRVELHREVARLLEGKLTDRKETPPYGELAHHFTQGKLWDKAIDYLEKAGEQAFASFTHNEAIGFFTNAVSLAGRASVGITTLRLARWERHLVDSHLALGDMPSAHGHAHSALGHCGFRLPTSRVGWFLGFVTQVLLRQVQRLVPTIFRVRSPDRRSLVNEAAYVLNRLSEPFFLAHKPIEGFYCGFRDLNLAERVPPSEALARGYATMAMVVGVGPLGKLGETWSNRAISIARALKSPGAVTYCLSRSGAACGSQTLWQVGIDRVAEAETIARSRSDLRQLGETLTIGALLYGFRGDYAASLARGEEVIQIGTSRGDNQLRHWGRNLVAHALVRAGRTREASPIVRQMIQFHATEEVGEAEKIFDLGTFALYHLSLGELPEARQYSTLVLEAVRKERFLPYFLKTGLDGTCDVLAALLERSGGDKADAPGLRADAREMVARLEKFAGLYAIARPRSLIYRGLLAWHAGDQTRAFALWTKAQALATSFGLPCDAGRAHFEIGRHLENGRQVSGADRGGHLAAARELLRSVGAALELRRMEEVEPAGPAVLESNA
jgi:serine/threonine protein kinase